MKIPISRCDRLRFAPLLLSATALLHSQATLHAQAPMPQIQNTSTANYRFIVAADSVVSAWGNNFANGTISANTNDPGTSTVTLPETLGGVKLSVEDAAKVVTTPRLFLVSPGQINYVAPAALPVGRATLTATGPNGITAGPLLVSQVSPGIFTADQSGSGVPAAQILRAGAGGSFVFEATTVAGTQGFVPRPIDLISNSNDKVFVFLYGTGIRGRSLNPVIATIGGVSVPVQFAGAQPQYPGLDQINLGPLPTSLAGLGAVDLIVTVDGVPANTVRLAFR